jgi:hypothetical protein
MKLIASDMELIKKLTNENSILDSMLEKIVIQKDDDDILFIDLVLNMRSSSKYKKIVIRMKDVAEYGFYYSSEYLFYYIERFKFFKRKDNAFYISLDPEDDSDEISESDQDFIVSNKIIGYELIEDKAILKNGVTS